MRRALAILLLAAAIVASVVPAAAGTAERHFAVSCATTVTEVVAANVNRLSLILVNNGAATLFIGSGNPAALTTATGVPIAAGASWRAEHAEYSGAMSCIVAAGTVDLRVQEILK